MKMFERKNKMLCTREAKLQIPCDKKAALRALDLAPIAAPNYVILPARQVQRRAFTLPLCFLKASERSRENKETFE